MTERVGDLIVSRGFIEPVLFGVLISITPVRIDGAEHVRCRYLWSSGIVVTTEHPQRV